MGRQKPVPDRAFEGVALPAPGKLNLMLRIVGRRPDGYHLLQTVFQFIDACDYLCFTLRQDGIVRRARPLPGVPEAEDLTVRAARLLQEYAGIRWGVDILLDKRLPMGGGLGGGSSDAATVLCALNRLWGLHLPLQRLMELGLRLGADVPVFVFGRSAWGEGVGERLEPVELPEPWYVIVVPACQVSTAAVFQSPDLTRNSPPITIRDFLAGNCQNDCLKVVRAAYPAVRSALQALGRFGEPRLTGTGGCVFLRFGDEAAARDGAEQLGTEWNVLVAKGCNESPLHATLDGGRVVRRFEIGA